jgi:hypothetical protein
MHNAIMNQISIVMLAIFVVVGLFSVTGLIGITPAEKAQAQQVLHTKINKLWEAPTGRIQNR